jgi:hypothetical protein
MWRIDHDNVRENGFFVRIAYWYVPYPKRLQLESFLIHSLHPKYNVRYPTYRGPWNLPVPDGEDVDPESILSDYPRARVRSCEVDNREGVYMWYTREG